MPPKEHRLGSWLVVSLESQQEHRPTSLKQRTKSPSTTATHHPPRPRVRTMSAGVAGAASDTAVSVREVDLQRASQEHSTLKPSTGSGSQLTSFRRRRIRNWYVGLSISANLEEEPVPTISFGLHTKLDRAPSVAETVCSLRQLRMGREVDGEAACRRHGSTMVHTCDRPFPIPVTHHALESEQCRLEWLARRVTWPFLRARPTSDSHRLVADAEAHHRRGVPSPIPHHRQPSLTTPSSPRNLGWSWLARRVMQPIIMREMDQGAGNPVVCAMEAPCRIHRVVDEHGSVAATDSVVGVYEACTCWPSSRQAFIHCRQLDCHWRRLC
ncbi:hypothetical protein CSHISOI_07906 [Colletotrichum shisoi]|uniref:Uncharacterized protein n=1 Tax=Colletotrichum shisoi TaxID=2078593 RepID=A0A5Q4BLB2_9PEZI|nr:hypothetical protein CSHISOI_07906 [Colletotrichum shisoi]